MDEHPLTEAFIKANKGFLELNFPKTEGFKGSKHILVVRADTTNFTRLMIYPVGSNKILKLLFVISKANTDYMKELASNFKDYQIIHNSGLILKKNKFIGEIYFDLNYSDSKYKDLKAYIDKNKSIFDEIELKEITTPP